jgi:pyruvate,water dikinase
VGTALAEAAPADELTGLVEVALAVTFEMVDGVSRLAADGAWALYARQLRLEESLRAALDELDAGGRAPSCLPLALPLEPGQVGGKAAGLSALLRNGFPVPDGFAVTARACREFLRATALDERIRQTLRAAGTDDAALAEACAAIRRDILATPLTDWLQADLHQAAAALAPAADGPLALAARSSALTEDRPEHSFAGQYTTELNLSAETLAQGFSKVMAGAFTDRAVAYRLEAGLPAATLDMAVLVQVMVPAVAAGVVFTVTRCARFPAGCSSPPCRVSASSRSTARCRSPSPGWPATTPRTR